jgi:hypothetical protein
VLLWGDKGIAQRKFSVPTFNEGLGSIDLWKRVNVVQHEMKVITHLNQEDGEEEKSFLYISNYSCKQQQTNNKKNLLFLQLHANILFFTRN